MVQNENDAPGYVGYLTIEAFGFLPPSVATAPSIWMHRAEVWKDLRRLFYTFRAEPSPPTAAGMRQPPLSCAPRFWDDHSESETEFAPEQLLGPLQHCPGRSEEIIEQELILTLVYF